MDRPKINLAVQQFAYARAVTVGATPAGSGEVFRGLLCP